MANPDSSSIFVTLEGYGMNQTVATRLFRCTTISTLKVGPKQYLAFCLEISTKFVLYLLPKLFGVTLSYKIKKRTAIPKVKLNF